MAGRTRNRLCLSDSTSGAVSDGAGTGTRRISPRGGSAYLLGLTASANEWPPARRRHEAQASSLASTWRPMKGRHGKQMVPTDGSRRRSPSRCARSGRGCSPWPSAHGGTTEEVQVLRRVLSFERSVPAALLVGTAAALFALPAVAFGGNGSSFQMQGKFETTTYSGAGCVSPIDLCADGSFRGTLTGPVTASATSVTPTSQPGILLGVPTPSSMIVAAT